VSDDRSETIGKKIRDAEMSKVPYMLIIGEQEEKDGTVSVRRHGEGDIGTMPIKDFAELIKNEIKRTHKAFEV
jgi:threonyl-tRNA synthetase